MARCIGDGPAVIGLECLPLSSSPRHWVQVAAVAFKSPPLCSSCRRCVQVTAVAFELPPLHSNIASLPLCFGVGVVVVIFLHPRLEAFTLASPAPRSCHLHLLELALAWTSSSSSRRPHPCLNFLIRRLSELVFSSSKSPPSSLLARLRMNTRPSPCTAGIPGLEYSLPVHGLGGPEGLVGVRRRRQLFVVLAAAAAGATIVIVVIAAAAAGVVVVVVVVAEVNAVLLVVVIAAAGVIVVAIVTAVIVAISWCWDQR